MTDNPPNWQWCQSLTKEEREEYHEAHKNRTFPPTKGNIKYKSANAIFDGWADKIQEPKRDIAICTIAGNQECEEQLEITRPAIIEYANKCGADYVELTGDQFPNWGLGNKYRVEQVAKKYIQTLYLDCDVVVTENAKNIFESAPKDKICFVNEVEALKKDARFYKEFIKTRKNIAYLTKKSYNDTIQPQAGVMLIPHLLSHKYSFKNPFYPGIWTYDQHLLALDVFVDEYSILPNSFNLEFIDKEFWHLLKDPFFNPSFIHINGARPHEYRMRVLERISKGNYNPILLFQDEPQKTFNNFVMKFPWSNNEKQAELFEIKQDKKSLYFYPKNRRIGKDQHRSGWDVLIDELKLELHSENGGILLEDFVEQNFLYSSYPVIHKSPWIGVFHQPFETGLEDCEIIGHTETKKLLTIPAFMESIKNLKLIVTLSDFLGKQWSEELNIPYVTLKYLTCDKNVPLWSYEKWKNNDRNILQLGWYLRQTGFIYSLDLNDMKCECLLNKKIEFHNKYHTKRLSEIKILNNKVNHIDYLSDLEYDTKLSESVIVTHMISNSANNAIVESILRNTPHIINKNEPTIEYLGKDYPLYWEKKEDVRSFLKDDSRILEAHEYLKTMNKDWLETSYFINDFKNKVIK
jgi:hypothetical protein